MFLSLYRLTVVNNHQKFIHKQVNDEINNPEKIIVIPINLDVHYLDYGDSVLES